MPTISTNTTVTVPAGALLMFKAGGIARAKDDAGNIYQIGLNDMTMGPYQQAQTIEILVTSGSVTYAVETDGNALDLLRKDPYTGQAVTPAGHSLGVNVPLLRDLVVYGESFAAQAHRALIPTSITVSNGLATVVHTSHGLYTGGLISVTGAAEMAVNVHQAEVTRIDANTFTFPAPGASNGVAANIGLQIQYLDLSSQLDNGILTHMQRRSGGAFRFLSNAGAPGHTASQCQRYWDQRVAAFAPDLIVRMVSYNDINQGTSVTDMLIAADQDIQRAAQIGATILVFNCSPWGSGAAANTASNRIRAEQFNNVLRALVAQYSNARYIDIYAATVDPATGLAVSGTLASDGIHPSTRWMDIAARLALESISGRFAPRRLVMSAIDSIANDAGSRQISRIGPWATTTGGGLGGGITAAIPADVTSPTAVAGAANGMTVSGTSVTGNAWIDVAQDGVGFAQYCRYTADANNDNARLTYTPTLADVSPGDVIDCVFLGTLTTAHNASNRTPAGQNVTSITAQLVVTNSDGTFNIFEARGSATTIQSGDITQGVFVIEGARVPKGSALSLVRLDFIANFGGAGSVQMAISHIEMRKR